jgi:spoIIIJ-associated protein
MADKTAKIKNKSEEILQNLGFFGEAIISQRGTATLVNFQLDEPGILIGRNGEALDALQHILRLLVGAESAGERDLLVVDINGYRKKRAGAVENIAREAAHKVRREMIEMELEPMNSYERRIVHTIVGTVADVESESVGERQNRRVKIKPKK